MKYHFKGFVITSAFLMALGVNSAFAATKGSCINSPTQQITICTNGISNCTNGISKEEFIKIWEQCQIPFPCQSGTYQIFESKNPQQNQTTNNFQQNQITIPEQIKTQDVSEYVQKVVELTNVERAKNGLPALTINVSLNAAAQKHAEDMDTNNYFSHTSQDGRTMKDRIQEYTSDYRTIGENIAMGQKTPEEVVNAWLNSPGHRANILNGSFQEIGIGYSHNYWVQNFLGK